jgi:hypothetical protein
MRAKIDVTNLRAVSDDIKEDVLKAAKASIRLAVRHLEQDLEAQTRGVVPGDRAWRAWSSETYPRGDKLSYSPAGDVFVRGGRRSQGMMEYFSLPGVNRAKRGKYLAVPLRAALGTSLGKKITPRQWEGRFGIKLRPFFRPGKTPLLVADGAIGPGGFIKADRAAAMRRGGQNVSQRVTVPVFALLDEQQHANRVSIQSAALRAQDKLSSDLAKRIARIG